MENNVCTCKKEHECFQRIISCFFSCGQYFFFVLSFLLPIIIKRRLRVATILLSLYFDYAQQEFDFFSPLELGIGGIVRVPYTVVASWSFVGAFTGKLTSFKQSPLNIYQSILHIQMCVTYKPGTYKCGLKSNRTIAICQALCPSLHCHKIQNE